MSNNQSWQNYSCFKYLYPRVYGALVVNVALVVNMCALVVSECIRCGFVALVVNVALVVVVCLCGGFEYQNRSLRGGPGTKPWPGDWLRSVFRALVCRYFMGDD